jgi:hypothetical protein
VDGVVFGPHDERVDGAVVAIVPMSDGDAESAATMSVGGGRFRFAGLPPGEYAITATAPGLTAAWVGGLTLEADKPPMGVRVRLGGDGVVLRGVVRDATGRPIEGEVLRFARISEQRGDLFLVTTDARGVYEAMLPRAAYDVREQVFVRRTAGGDETVDVVLANGTGSGLRPPLRPARPAPSPRIESAHSRRLDER